MIQCKICNVSRPLFSVFSEPCLNCFQKLTVASAVCEICYDFYCGYLKEKSNNKNECIYAHLKIQSARQAFNSLHAFYRFTDLSKPIFREWKKNPPFFEERIFFQSKLKDDLKPIFNRIHSQKIDAIIPIPQRKSRIFKLKRSTSLSIASYISKKINRPLLKNEFHALETKTQQGQLNGVSRYLDRNPFQINCYGKMLPKNILVVDDFMTSGQTIRLFAQLLRSRGCENIHVAVLALRPLYRKEQTL